MAIQIKKWNRNKIVDFIDEIEEREKGFLESNIKELKSFVKSFSPTPDYWYNLKVVELAQTLRICDLELAKVLMKMLLGKTHYLTKLTILDYFFDFFDVYNGIDSDLLRTFDKVAQSKRERIVVKNQAILFLVYFGAGKLIAHLDILKKNLIQTEAYHAHIRTINFIVGYCLEKIPLDEVYIIISISKRKKLGKALEDEIYMAEKSIKSYVNRL